MTLVDVFKKNQNEFGMILDVDYRTEPFSIIDFTKKNIDLENIKINNG